MELTARQDPKVQWEQQELTARLDRKVQWDQQERTELTAPSDRKVQWGPPVLLVPSVRRERMELMARSDLRV